MSRALALLLAAAGWATVSVLPIRAFADALPVTDGQFVLQDFLNRTWSGERVSFEVAGPALQSARAGKPLADNAGHPTPYQLSTMGGRTTLVFLANLQPFEKQVYHFADGQAAAAGDLQVEETPQYIRLSNRLIGIAIRRALKPGEGPIAGVRLNSGAWVGDSRRTGSLALTTFRAEVVQRGPVVAEVVARATFVDQQPWEIRCRVQAGEPVVEVDETFDVAGDAAWALSFMRNFAPDSLFYRSGKGQVGKNTTWKIGDDREPVFVLEPWLHWWERLRQNVWFGLYNSGGSDLLCVGARRPSAWVDPERLQAREGADNRKPSAPPRLEVVQKNGELVMTMPIRSGQRHWMFGAHDKGTSIANASDEKRAFEAPLPQQFVIKHGTFPLDLVKDYLFVWPDDHQAYPRLLLKEEQIARLRAAFKPDPARRESLLRSPITVYTLDEPISYYLGSGDPTLGQRLVEAATAWIQEGATSFVRQDDVVTLGCAPHHSATLITALNLADVALSDPSLSPTMRERLLAQIAFLGYTMDRPDYWSPERGFSANPNMTTTVAAFKGAVACLIPSHPAARTWIQGSLKELKENQLDTWSDANGGWLEAPHYAIVSYDYLMGFFLMARNAGFADHLYDTRMRKLGEWFAKISTPPDARVKGWRHLPSIGNTYVQEPTGLFAHLAYLWRERDPQFAAEMQWMFQQQGQWPSPGVGGFFPTLGGYRTLLRDDTIPARAPAYGSEVFPQTGLVLRNQYPSPRETYLDMIQGTNHSHYDADSGSVVIYGKGRIVSDDFGYYGLAPGDDHNMVIAEGAPDSGIMRVRQFAPAPALDYALAVKNNQWTRQIAFVKDADPEAPNYFVIADTMARPADATWRLYFPAVRVSPSGQSALVEGREDVDTDLFFARPAQVTLRTEEKTRTSGSGLTADARQAAITTTQIGVIASIRKGKGFLSVIYPRLKTQPRPQSSAIAEGRGVKIVTPRGTDYVFLSPTPLTYRDEFVEFAGTCGAVQMRPGRILANLGAAGRLRVAGQTLQANQAAAKEWER